MQTSSAVAERKGAYLKRRSRRQIVSRPGYKRKQILAQDAFQDGKILIVTAFKGVSSRVTHNGLEFFETYMSLHGFPLYFSHSTREEAIDCHRSFCRIYRDF